MPFGIYFKITGANNLENITLIVPKRDARCLCAGDREKLRHRAIELWEKGMKPSDISNRLGVSLASIYNWRARHREGGDEAIKSKPRRGIPKKVQESRMRSIALKIIITLPKQHGHGCGLWSKALIGLDLERQNNLKLSRWTLGRLCRELGLQAKHRILLGWIRQSCEDAGWANKLISEAKKKADDKVRLYVVNVSPIEETSMIGKVWQSDPPIGPTSSGCCMISAVAPRGDVHFMVAPQILKENHFQDFIDRLMTGQTGWVVLVVSKDLDISKKAVQESERKYAGRLWLTVISGFEGETRAL
jgi:transposase